MLPLKLLLLTSKSLQYKHPSKRTVNTRQQQQQRDWHWLLGKPLAYCNLVKLPMESGMLPVRLLLLKSKFLGRDIAQPKRSSSDSLRAIARQLVAAADALQSQQVADGCRNAAAQIVVVQFQKPAARYRTRPKSTVSKPAL